MGNNEIQKIESPLAAAAALVSADGNMDVAKLEKLLDMQERWEATQAKKAYTQAMSEFKANPPEILKDQHVSYQTSKGVIDYNHSSLYNVTSCINTELSKYGLTASWVTSQDGGAVKVTCKVTHIMGHSEETSLTAPPDTTGSKNTIQAIGSTVTYLQRYTLLALTGLATCEQDDDGKGADKKPPRPAGPTDKNFKVLDMIIEKLELTVTKDRAIDSIALMSVFKNKSDYYPSDPNKVDAAVKYILGLNEENTWTVPRNFKDDLVDKSRTSDEVFKGYEAHHDLDDEHYIERGMFNVLAEDCIVEPEGDLIQWAIDNIPVETLIAKRPF